MGNLKIYAIALSVGFAVYSIMGLFAFLQYAFIVMSGFLFAHFVNRKAPQYPTKDIYKLFRENPHHKGEDATGLVIIVTGSTSGIGQRVAQELYAYGATVVIAARNPTKSEGIIEELRTTCPGSKGKLVHGKLDTSDLDSVRDFVTWFNGQFDHVDYLVNNAGIQYGSSENTPLTNMNASIASKQGYDQSFATNYMGHFLLTHLLLPKIKARVINVASSFHFQPDGKSLDPALGSDGKTPDAARSDIPGFRHRVQAYGVTKLAQVLHSKELQRRLPGYGYAATSSAGGTNITIVSICPGWVRTNILGDDIMGAIIAANAFPVKEGILSTMGAIFDKSLQGGEFLSNQRIPFRTQSWFDGLLYKLAEMKIRDMCLFGLAFVLNLVQSYTYGYHVHPPSAEADDPALAAALYDWTFNELKEKGYINE
mmetsp:Transcript_6173/g.10308  ORF Transcript_6173/g.10308 Transcript_6173/m.10308 type:complete len:425 (-) Transcript_6173:107-1381(-)